MKVLVTGFSGRLGPYVLDELLEAGHEIVLFSRRDPPSRYNHLPLIKGDINVFEDCLRAVKGGFDSIQHLAAQPYPTDHPILRDRAEEAGVSFDTTMKSNIMGTYYLLQAALKEEIKIFVMTGSNCALGHGYRISDSPFPFSYLPVDEKHPSDVEDSYSLSKLVGEKLLASYTKAYGIRTYAIRAAVICNPERRREMKYGAKTTTGWNPWLWAWVGSEDVALAHRLLMEKAHDIEEHGVFFCNGDDTTALEPSLELVQRYRPNLLPVVRTLKGNASFISNKKLKKTVGWKPRTSWRGANK